MASSRITSWQIDGETVETVTDFILGGSKITADGDCSHGIKRHLLLGRKTMIKLDSILKSRDITLPTMVCLVKAMVFPVVVYGCESWTIKKPGHKRIDAFELWCWRRLLRVLYTVRRSNQSILKEISPEYTLEGLMLKLKLQYFGHLMRRTDSLEKTLMLGKIEGGKDWCWEGDDRGWDGWIASLTPKSGMLQSMGSQRFGHDWVTEIKATRYLPLCASISSSIQLRCWARWVILFTFSILWTLSSFLDSTFSIQWDHSGSVSR